MKNYYLTTILLILSVFAQSQEIVNPNKLWSIMSEHCQPWGSTYSTDFFMFDEDTIINDTLYQKVWISEDEDHEEWNFYGAFIREVDNRVYYRQMFGNEGLIYDFNLELGDSVVVNNPRSIGEISLFLNAIDSVETENGYTERWTLVNELYPDYEYWIKGIGGQTGVINSSTGIYGGMCGLFTLLCNKEEGELVYLNPDYESCFLHTTGRDELDENNQIRRLIYNANQKSISVNLQGESSKKVVLSNISGKIISTTQTNSNTIKLYLGNNSAGIFFLTIIQNGKLSTHKFIAY